MFVMTEVELGLVASERLEAELTTLAAHLHAGMCRFLLMVAEFDRRRLFEAWDCRGTAQWLVWKCGVSARTGAEMHKGEKVLLLFASANRDDRQFPDGD